MDTDELILGNHTVARMSADFGRVNSLRSRSALGMPAIEVLAGLTSQNPTGVVLIEHHDDGLAFALEQGRVVGAFGTGDTGLMESWCSRAQAQGIQAKATGSVWVGLMQAFVERCVLSRLELATRVGSNLTVVRGEVEWTDARLDANDAQPLSHLLMEHARELDDQAKFERRLRPLDRYIFPATDPDKVDKGPQAAAESTMDSECSFAGLVESFTDDTMPRRDMRAVWSMCDGKSTLAELSTRCLLGPARTLAALYHLRRGGCIELSPAPPPPVVRPPASTRTQPDPVDAERLRSQYKNPAVLQGLIESFIGNMPGWLADLDRAASGGLHSEYARVCGQVIGASGAVAATPLLELATEAQTAAFRGADDLPGRTEAIEGAYAAAFRALLSLHTAG